MCALRVIALVDALALQGGELSGDTPTSEGVCGYVSCGVRSSTGPEG